MNFEERFTRLFNIATVRIELAMMKLNAPSAEVPQDLSIQEEQVSDGVQEIQSTEG